jgi:CheY-like chemotaxis protein
MKKTKDKKVVLKRYLIKLKLIILCILISYHDNFNNSTALIIGGQKLQNHLIMRNLPKHFNWFWAKTIQESVQIYEDLEKKYITIDVLFLDLFLQDSKGIEFLKISKTKDWLENTLIVIMTDSKENEIIKKCNDCLINRSYTFYSKPIKNVDFACISEEIIKHIKKISCPLKDYKIIKHIATGAEADVYKVIGIKNRKIFAMKVNKEKNLYPAEDKFLKKINSPNVIHLYEYKKIKGKVYMIL